MRDTIKISNYYFDKCKKFAESQLSTSADLYFYRGERNKAKMFEDIVVGKMAEIASYKYLKGLGYEVKKPDFTIYERRNKSFDADLSTKCGLSFHVKSQHTKSVFRYGHSWLLQKSDKLVKEPSKQEFFIFTQVRSYYVDILGIARATDVVPHLQDPVVPRYRSTKKALYLDYLKEKRINLKRF